MQAVNNLSQMDVASLWHPLTQHKSLRQNPPARMVKSKGCYLTDQHGETYLDAVAGIWCVNVGYGRQGRRHLGTDMHVSDPGCWGHGGFSFVS